MKFILSKIIFEGIRESDSIGAHNGIRFSMKTFTLYSILLILLPTASADELRPVDREKLVIFYPSYGYQPQNKDKVWRIPIRLWVSEELDLARKLTLKTARKVIEQKIGIDDLTDEQKQRFKERAGDFLRDSESNIEISIRFNHDPDKILYRVWDYKGEESTDRNGVLSGLIEISSKRAEQLLKAQGSEDGWLSYFSESEEHFGEGRIRLIPQQGISIISDIDDTIKVTNIPLGSNEILNNTFFAPFKKVPGMSDRYQAFPADTAFHYVSGGPWQLYRPLSTFLVDKNRRFPAGSFHMKNVRTNFTDSETYDDLAKLMAGGATQKQKVEQISQIISHFPRRQFILIGDSGEHDPEVFSEVRKRFSNNISKIIIRDVLDENAANNKRFENMEVIR